MVDVECLNVRWYFAEDISENRKTFRAHAQRTEHRRHVVTQKSFAFVIIVGAGGGGGVGLPVCLLAHAAQSRQRRHMDKDDET